MVWVEVGCGGRSVVVEVGSLKLGGGLAVKVGVVGLVVDEGD